MTHDEIMAYKDGKGHHAVIFKQGKKYIFADLADDSVLECSFTSLENAENAALVMGFHPIETKEVI